MSKIEYKREAFSCVSDMVRWLNAQDRWQLVSFVLGNDECVAVLSRKES